MNVMKEEARSEDKAISGNPIFRSRSKVWLQMNDTVAQS